MYRVGKSVLRVFQATLLVSMEEWPHFLCSCLRHPKSQVEEDFPEWCVAETAVPASVREMLQLLDLTHQSKELLRLFFSLEWFSFLTEIVAGSENLKECFRRLQQVSWAQWLKNRKFLSVYSKGEKSKTRLSKEGFRACFTGLRTPVLTFTSVPLVSFSVCVGGSEFPTPV